MNEARMMAVEIAKNRCNKFKEEYKLVRLKAENCAKLIFEVFKASDNIIQVKVKSNSSVLSCGVSFSKMDSKFYFLEDFNPEKVGLPVSNAIKAINGLEDIKPNIVWYTAVSLANDYDIVNYYSIDYDSQEKSVTVSLRDLNEIKAICESEEPE